MPPQLHREDYSSFRHTANKSIPNGLFQCNIAQSMSGRRRGRPFNQKSTFVFSRSSRRGVLHLRASPKLLKELQSNVDSFVVGTAPGSRRSVLERSLRDPESDSYGICTAPPKMGKQKTTFSIFPYVALVNPFGMNKKI